MSLFDLQDVCMVIGSLVTLDLPMVVDLIGIFVLKGPYCTLTMTDWFLQVLSVIPRGSWGDVARRFTMIRWVNSKMWFRSHKCYSTTSITVMFMLKAAKSSRFVPSTAEIYLNRFSQRHGTTNRIKSASSRYQIHGKDSLELKSVPGITYPKSHNTQRTLYQVSPEIFAHQQLRTLMGNNRKNKSQGFQRHQNRSNHQRITAAIGGNRLSTSADSTTSITVMFMLKAAKSAQFVPSTAKIYLNIFSQRHGTTNRSKSASSHYQIHGKDSLELKSVPEYFSTLKRGLKLARNHFPKSHNTQRMLYQVSPEIFAHQQLRALMGNNRKNKSQGFQRHQNRSNHQRRTVAIGGNKSRHRESEGTSPQILVVAFNKKKQQQPTNIAFSRKHQNDAAPTNQNDVTALHQLIPNPFETTTSWSRYVTQNDDVTRFPLTKVKRRRLTSNSWLLKPTAEPKRYTQNAAFQLIKTTSLHHQRLVLQTNGWSLSWNNFSQRNS
ncbi:hypothetical protein F511_04422 [Dorcoceras hygrometricum]|uniref:Uncharacterized protein n=1 Tax=Dorcoceras hygrometricum TaxID=472368 RepID=A0A2Z7D6S3_9LAMI|nr:hypothetical protein F511_04422 [Dorcoceras hygrometricum]